MSTEYVLALWKATSENNMEEVIKLIKNKEFTIDIGITAVGIALARKHNDIAYELLSQEGALDKYFDRPFIVDRYLRDAVANYIIKKNKNTSK